LGQPETPDNQVILEAGLDLMQNCFRQQKHAHASTKMYAGRGITLPWIEMRRTRNTSYLSAPKKRKKQKQKDQRASATRIKIAIPTTERIHHVASKSYPHLNAQAVGMAAAFEESSFNRSRNRCRQ